MRIRKMDQNGDMLFGQSLANFYINEPAGVAQSMQTRFQLWVGEWFLDQTAGMPWATQVLGSNTQTTYDPAIQQRALDTPGVIELNEYSSSFNGATRVLTVSIGSVITQYGTTQALNVPLVPPGG